MKACLALLTFWAGAGYVFAQEGSSPKASVAELITQLDDKNPVARYQAARSLILMGPAAKEAVPKLIEKLEKDKDEPARAAYAEALGIIGPVSKEVIPRPW